MAVLLGGELVQYSDVVDIIDNMTNSVDLNGPADCVDSACTLWSIIMLLKGKENIRLVSDTSEHIVRWLCARWKPGKLLAKSNLSLHISHINYSKVYFHHCSPHDIFILISVCLGFHCLSPSVPPLLNLGPIFQAQHKFLKEEKLIRYLLLIDDSAAEHDEARPNAIMYNSFITLSKSQFQFLSDIVLDFLIAESALLLRDVFVNRSQGIPNTVTDVIFAASSLNIIGYGLITQSQIRESRKGKDLRTIIEKLKNQIISCASSQDREYYLVDGILESFGPFLGPLKDLASRKTVISNTAVSMARGFDSEFWGNLGKRSSQLSIDEDDPMDLDDGFESQTSRNGTEKGVLEISHDDVTASTDLIAYRNNLAMKICFLSSFKEPVHDEELGDHFDSKSFMRHLTSLRPHDFLACRPFIRELFDMSNPMDIEDARMLLEYLVHKILRPYEFERCEVSLSACLEIMTGLAEMWTHDDGDISDLGGSLYDWFINIALNRGISSPQVHSSISSMLQRVIKVRPEYAKTRSESLPSVRTSLFRVLQEGNIRVKFHVGQNISEIFGLFVLTEHDNILEDVISNLPSVLHWQEGIALRLFVLAHLAASWPTLLRRCVYAIFETPGHDPESVGHAKHCLTIVSEKLRLESLQTLFKLFVSQIIYTWFETKPLRAIPYAIFGYVSLAELLQDVQDEVIGQIVMRGKDNEAAQLANDLGVSYEQLLKLSFSKAAAYSISRDIAVPPLINTQAPGAEARLRKILGKEQYASLVNANFPEILAYFYKNLDDIEDIQKGFQKGPVYTKAYISYQRIISISASVTVLPVNQQPSFKARFLVDEIEFLCRRTSYEPESMWSPELYVFVFRELLDTVHSALGSLHACSVLRRIRLLICMAGSTALELYPLEMALHALRPYLINTHCAEDAIGMVQYLLEYGAQYLKEVPSFLAGMAISTLTSMKVFLGSSQESTTQESQFRATMSKAHDFHRWFANYLDGYISPHITGKSEQSFKALVKAARNAHSKGNPTRGTYESDLLLEIFEDQCSGRCILNQPAQDLILGLLCTTFEVPSNSHDDILGMDEQTALYAPVIWKICRRSYHGQPYLLWVGRILGRAYACTGLIDREMKLETRLESSHREVSAFSTEFSQSSRSSILKLLCDIVLIDNPTKIGMAERVLRSIITRVYRTEYYLECEQTIPNSLMKGLLWRHYLCPLVASQAPSHQSMLKLAAFNSNKTSAMKWIQELCIALANVEVDDPILSELPRILKRMEDLAEQAFSYVLHLVLQKEIDSHQTTRRIMSEACSLWFTNCDASTIPHVKMLLKAILYLRKQPLPQENAKADRSQWLEIDFKLAAEAAVKCDMFKTALMFLEISYSEEAKAARRSSRIKVEEPTDLLLYIFQNIDEQDAFYGVQQPSSLSSMMSRLEYENAGFKSLSFRGAHYDSRIRLAKGDYEEDEGNVVKILDTLDLNGLSQSFLSKMTNIGTHSVDSMLRTARKLEQWDISSPTLHFSSTNTVFRVFQGINKAADLDSLNAAIDAGFQESMEMLMKGDIADSSLQKILSTLCILTEAEEILSSKDANDLHETWSRFIARDDWMKSAR